MQRMCLLFSNWVSVEDTVRCERSAIDLIAFCKTICFFKPLNAKTIKNRRAIKVGEKWKFNFTYIAKPIYIKQHTCNITI